MSGFEYILGAVIGLGVPLWMLLYRRHDDKGAPFLIQGKEVRIFRIERARRLRGNFGVFSEITGEIFFVLLFGGIFLCWIGFGLYCTWEILTFLF